jgi:hypothetical protein
LNSQYFFFALIVSGIFIALHVNGRLDEMIVTDKSNILAYCAVLPFIASLLNPIVYSIKIAAVRVRFRSVFCRCCRKAGDRVYPDTSTMVDVVCEYTK